jgi:hypothetical protein
MSFQPLKRGVSSVKVASAICALAGTLGALLALSVAQAAESTPVHVRLSVRLAPDRLGQSSSIALQLRVGTHGAAVPPALERMDVLYPRNFGIALSGLGVETCTA